MKTNSKKMMSKIFGVKMGMSASFCAKLSLDTLAAAKYNEIMTKVLQRMLLFCSGSF